MTAHDISALTAAALAEPGDHERRLVLADAYEEAGWQIADPSAEYMGQVERDLLREAWGAVGRGAP